MKRIGLVLIAVVTLLFYSATFAQQAPVAQRANPFGYAPVYESGLRPAHKAFFPSMTTSGPWRRVDPALVSELAKAKNDDERKTIEEKIRWLLADEFDKQAAKEERQLKDLQARIDRVQQRLKNRIAGKSLLVDLRLQQMLDQADRVDGPIATQSWRATTYSPFARPTTPLAPKMPLPAPTASIRPPSRSLVSCKTEVKPGDELLIENRADKDMNRRVKVLADNTIQIPLLGFVSVEGMSTTEIQKTLNEKAASHYQNPACEVFLSGVSEPIGGSDSELR